MPIVVDWNPVQALGSLAVSAGAAQGQTAGNRDFISRQFAVDQQTADINQRNREIGMQSREEPARFAREQQAAADSDARRFQSAADLGGLKQQGDVQMEGVRSQRAMETQDFQLRRQEEGIQQRQEADYQYDNQRQQDQENRLRESLSRTGRSPEEVESVIDQVRIDQGMQTGNFARGGQRGSVEAKRPPGTIRSFGFDAARSGALDQITPRMIRELKISGSGIKPESMVIGEVLGGAYDYWASESTPIEEVQWAASNPQYPDFVRQEAARVLTTRGDVKFGANQARPNQNGNGSGGVPQTQGDGLESARTEDLMRIINQGFRNAP